MRVVRVSVCQEYAAWMYLVSQEIPKDDVVQLKFTGYVIPFSSPASLVGSPERQVLTISGRHPFVEGADASLNADYYSALHAIGTELHCHAVELI